MNDTTYFKECVILASIRDSSLHCNNSIAILNLKNENN